jgi:hypothetical protein
MRRKAKTDGIWEANKRNTVKRITPDNPGHDAICIVIVIVIEVIEVDRTNWSHRHVGSSIRPGVNSVVWGG